MNKYAESKQIQASAWKYLWQQHKIEDFKTQNQNIPTCNRKFGSQIKHHGNQVSSDTGDIGINDGIGLPYKKFDSS